MAVPFNIPEDHEVDVIINQLQSLLTKLQAAVRRSRGPTTRSSQATATRVRSPASNRLRSRDESSSTTSISSTNFPDLFNNLAWLAAASQDAAFGSNSSLTANSVIRSPRRRTSSESSNCKETKISITAIVNHAAQDWNQGDGSSDSEPEQASGDGLLSKFVPGPVSAPLWTAMICFVGWHLFRAR